jgi:hypothetical protein
VSRAVLDRERLADLVGRDPGCGEEVFGRIDGTEIAESERHVDDFVERPPQVYDPLLTFGVRVSRGVILEEMR